MKRSFLKSLGLENDVIDSIMDENGRDIEAEKEKASVYKTELDELKKVDVEKLKTEHSSVVEELNSQIEALTGEVTTNKDLVTQLTNEKAEVEKTFQKNHQIDLALMSSKAKNLKAVKALISKDQLAEVTFEDGKSEKLDEIITKLKESDSYLFGDTEGVGYDPKRGKDGESTNTGMEDAILQSLKNQGMKL